MPEGGNPGSHQNWYSKEHHQPPFSLTHLANSELGALMQSAF
jgi:hypothetical protein